MTDLKTFCFFIHRIKESRDVVSFMTEKFGHSDFYLNEINTTYFFDDCHHFNRRINTEDCFMSGKFKSVLKV